MKDINHSFFEFTPLKEAEAFSLNPLSLAFVGDAVYTLFIRHRIAKDSTAKSGKLHKLATEFIKASAQSKTLEKILPMLTERESDLVRRSRNTKINNSAKSATPAEYMQSTAYEALLGYLYMTGQRERLEEILQC
jgi:ribonuclease-3 family protein